MTNKQRIVLFVCIHNSGRSQMAEAFFNRAASGRAIAYSAGTSPGDEVNPKVVRAMVELGIDLTHKRPQLLNQDMLDAADRVITMGCNVEDICPANLVPTVDWGLEDPKDKSLDKVLKIRDEVQHKVASLIEEMSPTAGGS